VRSSAADVVLAGTQVLPSALAPGIPFWLALPLLAAVVAAWTVAARAHRAIGWFGVAAAAYLVQVCVGLGPFERLLLPLVPLVVIALAAAARTPLRPVAHGTAWLLLVLTAHAAVRLPGALRTFVDHHPHAEIQALRELAGDATVRQVGSSGNRMTRYVQRAVAGVPAPAQAAFADRRAVAEHVLAHCRGHAIDAVVLGRRTGGRMYRALATGELPDGLVRLRVDDDVVCLQVTGAVIEGEAARTLVDTFAVEPRLWRDGPLRVAFAPAAAIAARVVAAKVRLVGGAGPAPHFDLAAAAGVWRAEIVFRPPPGIWTLQGVVHLDDGGVLLTAPAAVEVGAPR
jgi:hypothetical protein